MDALVGLHPAVLYLLAGAFGDRLRRGRLGRRLGEDAWTNAEAFLAGRGGRAVAAARFVAVVHALVPVVAGSVRMRYRRFLGWSVLGAVTWSVTLVGIGALAGASWRRYGEHLGLAGLVVLGAVALAAWSLRAARRRRRAAMVGRPGPGHALPVGHGEGTGDGAADHRCGTRP